MTERAPDVSVIICTYTGERWDDLVAAVDSVRAQHSPPREIIVVVDHNPRLYARVLSQIPGVVAVPNYEHRGLSGSRNSGIAVAQGTVVAFLDDDAMAEPDWLERLLRGYEDPAVLGVGGAIRPAWLSGRPGWFPAEFHWVVGCSYRGLPVATATVRNLIGANMSFRRDALQEIGGFRSGFGQVGTSMLRCDDTEICIRAQRRWPQRLFLYEPRARIHHRVPASRARWGYFRSRCYTEGSAKALLAQLVGSRAGLATERAYTLQTLPSGAVRALADSIRRGDPSGPLRAGAIAAGLALTAAGYLVGATSGRWQKRRGNAQHAEPPRQEGPRSEGSA